MTNVIDQLLDEMKRQEIKKKIEKFQEEILWSLANQVLDWKYQEYSRNCTNAELLYYNHKRDITVKLTFDEDCHEYRFGDVFIKEELVCRIDGNEVQKAHGDAIRALEQLRQAEERQRKDVLLSDRAKTIRPANLDAITHQIVKLTEAVRRVMD